MSTQTHTRRPASAPHVFMAGDEVALMDWGRRSYMVATVTYFRHGEALNLRDVFSGDAFHMVASDVVGSMVQAVHHHGHGPDRPQVGRIVRADGSVHYITGDGRCLQCYVD